ncbi:hypothetical protein HBA55_37045, partial [Pseudomaricurvus alkylphenolicus]|uniref:hypothetical protein n=1 Tax=Pseudomaricurvus alkylphenolicus TaxID=1306991 RepID=UPI00141E7E01
MMINDCGLDSLLGLQFIFKTDNPVPGAEDKYYWKKGDLTQIVGVRADFHDHYVSVSYQLHGSKSGVHDQEEIPV